MKNLEDLAKFPSENPNPVFRVTENKVLYVNKTGELLFSIKEGDKIPKLFQSELTEALNKNILKTKEVEIDKFSYILDIAPIKEEGYANIYGRNITDLKTTENALKESEKTLKNIIETIPIGILISNPEGTVSEINSQVFKIFGYDSKKDFLNIPAIDHYYNPADRHLIVKMLESGLVKNFKLKFKRKDGTIFWGSVTSIAQEIGNQTIYIDTFQDITDHKKIEEEVADLAKFPEENPNPVLRVSKEFVLYTNQTGQDLFNIKIGNRIPILLRDIIHKTFEENVIQNLEVALNRRFYSIFVTPIKGTNYVNIYGMDITERKRAEQNLKESEEKYRDLYESAPNAYLSVKPDKSIIRCNNAAVKLLGYNKEELIGMTLFEIYSDSPEGLPKAKKIFQKFLEGKHIQDKELQMRHKNGNPIWVSVTVEPMKNQKGQVLESRSMIIDITERKNAEVELQKSEATYREAYNRAEFYKDIFTHDINNILQNISNGIQLNEMYLNKPDKSNKIKRNIDIIKTQVKRGANLVSNVRKLSKISESEALLINVNCIEVLTKSINYIKNAFQDKNIKIEVQINENNYKILANELLEDVFDNILTNSINYNDSEVINIEVKITKELRQGINYIKMQFIDNGIGITDERKPQIFIRGYSEETSVHGMGLGLSLVKKIVNSYNGEIWMEDRVKDDYTKGTNCIILIPEVINNG